MITLKEYEIYLKVKKFIETKDCEENEIIPKLINGIGVIPAYVPLIIESNDMEPTKYYSLSAAEGGAEFLSKRSFMHIQIGARGGKVDLRCLGLSGWINFIWDETDSC